MEELKRYKIKGPMGSVEESPEGDFVTYEDYLDLYDSYLDLEDRAREFQEKIARVGELKAEAKQLLGTVSGLISTLSGNPLVGEQFRAQMQKMLDAKIGDDRD